MNNLNFALIDSGWKSGTCCSKMTEEKILLILNLKTN